MKYLLFIVFGFCFATFAQVAPSAAPSVAISAAVATTTPGIIAWLQANSGMIFGVLFGLSETLALIPSIKSNSVFQLIFNFLQSIAPKS